MAGKKLSAVYVSWPKPNFAVVVSTNKHFRTNFHMALTYAHYELTANQLKKEVAVYLKAQDAKNPLLDKIKDIDENRFMTIGKYMYVLNHGGEVPEDILKSVMPALEKLIYEEEAKFTVEGKKAIQEAEKRSVVSTNVANSPAAPTIQDRIKDKAREVAGEVEGWLDDYHLDRKVAVKTVDEFVALFKAGDLKAPHVRYIQGSFARRKGEVDETLLGKDKELAEAYSHYSKPELKKVGQFYTNLMNACAMLQEVAKVERAPRKKKPVSAEKVVSKLKYKKDDSSLGIVSLNPVQIVGSKEIWVYNTKTRKLSQYKAVDERGLSVKGTGLLNYSTDSVEKTVRKPVETLADFKKASKVKLRTFLKELTTLDVPASGKLNEHCVLLRVDK